MALGVPERANLLSNSYENPPGGMVLLSIKSRLVTICIFIFSFSDVFYIDATDEQTLQTDLEAITPENTERSVRASLRWLASQRKGNWLLFFDNADDVNLQLKKFFPSCMSGNILVTTRNRELRHYSAKYGDAKVTGMDHKDATNLLLHLTRAEESDKNKALAEAIVQVHSFIFISLESSQTKARHRNSATLPWLSHKLALTFIATRH